MSHPQVIRYKLSEFRWDGILRGFYAYDLNGKQLGKIYAKTVAAEDFYGPYNKSDEGTCYEVWQHECDLLDGYFDRHSKEKYLPREPYCIMAELDRVLAKQQEQK